MQLWSAEWVRGWHAHGDTTRLHCIVPFHYRFWWTRPGFPVMTPLVWLYDEDKMSGVSKKVRELSHDLTTWWGSGLAKTCEMNGSLALNLMSQWRQRIKEWAIIRTFDYNYEYPLLLCFILSPLYSLPLTVFSYLYTEIGRKWKERLLKDFFPDYVFPTAFPTFFSVPIKCIARK